MKALLFGTGDYYRKYREWFRPEDVLGLIDNDESKRGTFIDGHKIYLPYEAVNLPYDCIVILSVYEGAMRTQLMGLGVPDEKIYAFSELYRHPELIADDRAVCLWGSDDQLSGILPRDCGNAILLMSHNLDFNGASLALFYLAQILIKNGYSVFVASWSDGALRQKLYKENIPVVVDPNLQMRTHRETEWAHGFHRIICNTLNYYQFLSDRNLEDKVVWWLHDPLMFYKTLDKGRLYEISGKNLTVCAVSPIAELAFKEYFPTFEVTQMVYGIPDVSVHKQSHDKMVFITIGNVQEYKGQDILVKALKRLGEEERRQIQVNIVGFQPSAYANTVKALAEDLLDVVNLLPPVGREEIHKLLDMADILVCPSLADTMSIVTNEGMQHCLPCIVSEAAGVATYIEDGESGFIVKQGDVGALEEKIRWCIEHKDKLEQMGKKSRLVYEKYFSMATFEENLMKVVRPFM